MAEQTVLILGSGFMGSGIAQVTAFAGFRVLWYDLEESLVQKGRDKICQGLDRRVAQGKCTTHERDALLGRITPTFQLSDAAEVDYVIEAVVEDKQIKMDLFRQLCEFCGERNIIATNTSSIPISDLACAVSHPERFIGMHFFSPVPTMKLVEVVRGIRTSRDTCDRVLSFVEQIGKVGVKVKDSPGFLVNRVNNAFRNEVFRCLEEGVASIEDIDTAIRLGLGHPMGPFELNDFTGLDIGLAVAQMLWESYKDPKWAPNLTLKKLVESGDLGRKSGKGWYDYSSGEKKTRDDIEL